MNNNFAALPDVLPNNVNVEIALLGSILLDPSAIYQVAEHLPAEAFYISSHKDIYQACLALYKKQQEVNLMTVTSWLADKDLLSRVGGQNKLASIVDSAVTSASVDGYADIILEKYISRQLSTIGNELQYIGHDTDKPLAWRLEQAEQKVLNITQLRKAKTGKSYWQAIDDIAFERLCKDLDEVEAVENAAQRDWLMKKLAKKWKFSSKKELLDFHAKWLDSRSKSKTYTAKEYFEKHGLSEQEWLIPGFIPAESVIVLYADGGVGKTRLAFSLARSAVTGGTFAYEGTEFDPMNTLLIETDQGPRITSKLLEMQELVDGEHCQRLHICDEWSVGEFGKLKAMLKQHQPKLVIIDSLTSISVDSLYSENEAEYARPLVRLRHLAKEFGCSFLVIHHSNANGDMRGSRAIRNTVDEVWKFTKTQTEIETYNCLTIDKTRSRAPASYKFTYDDDAWGWKFKGRVEDNAIAPGSEAQSTRIMFQCIDYLKKNLGIPYECVEVANALGLNINSVRRDLKRAVAEGLVNSGRSRTNKRALIYYIGVRKNKNELLSNITTDQLITTDQIADQIENDVIPTVSPSSDQLIKLISDFENSNCEDNNFSDQIDQLISSTCNPDVEPKLSDHTHLITSGPCDQLSHSVTIDGQKTDEQNVSQTHKEFSPGDKVRLLTGCSLYSAGTEMIVHMAGHKTVKLMLLTAKPNKDTVFIFRDKDQVEIISDPAPTEQPTVPKIEKGKVYWSKSLGCQVKVVKVFKSVKRADVLRPREFEKIRLELSDLFFSPQSFVPGDRVEVLAPGECKGKVFIVSSMQEDSYWLKADADGRRNKINKPVGPFKPDQLKRVSKE